MKKIICVAMMMVTMLCSSVCLAYPVSYTNYVDASLNYTGAIIDCRGLGLQTAMSPVIRADNGKIIYSRASLDHDLIASQDVVGYAKNFNDPAVRRAGDFPVIFKAVGLTNDNTCPVIDITDSLLLNVSSLHYNYLAYGAVVLIKD